MTPKGDGERLRTFVRRFAPLWLRRFARFVRELPDEARDLALALSDPLRPVGYRRLVGGGDFEKMGREHAELLRTLGSLRPSDRILDVGCGIGRTAVALTRSLTAQGQYRGFDIGARGIHWCRRNVTPKFPNFRFEIANVFNEYYNPGGEVPASRYRFPFDDEWFDLVFAASLFTHLLPDAADNYLANVARVLKPGGRCVITYFLLDRERLAGAPLQATFPHPVDEGGVCRVMSSKMPEEAVAFDEAYIRGLYERHGLRILEPIHYGSWTGTRGRIYQDVIAAEKRPSAER